MAPRKQAQLGTGKPSTASIPASPEVKAAINRILANTNMSKADKMKAIRAEAGLSHGKKPKMTEAQRKEAAKKYHAAYQAKKKAEILALAPELAPKPRVKLSEEERKAKKKEYRKKRARSHDAFMREMAKSNPTMAKKYGIDVTKFKM